MDISGLNKAKSLTDRRLNHADFIEALNLDENTAEQALAKTNGSLEYRSVPLSS